MEYIAGILQEAEGLWLVGRLTDIIFIVELHKLISVFLLTGVDFIIIYNIMVF